MELIEGKSSNGDPHVAQLMLFDFCHLLELNMSIDKDRQKLSRCGWVLKPEIELRLKNNLFEVKMKIADQVGAQNIIRNLNYLKFDVIYKKIICVEKQNFAL